MPCRDCIGCPYAEKDPSHRVVRAFGGRLVVDRRYATIELDGREPVRVQPQIASIIAALAMKEGKAVSEDHLHLAMSGRKEDRGSNNVDVRLHQIRRMTPKFPGMRIKNHWGVGWELQLADIA